MLGQRVVGVDAAGVSVAGRDGETERIAARTVVWAAGVTASALASRLAELTGAGTPATGRTRSSRPSRSMSQTSAITTRVLRWCFRIARSG